MPWGRRGAVDSDEGLDALEARLGPGERLLATARTQDGDLVGGTRRTFYLPDDVALGWHDIEHAEWNQDAFALDIETLPIDGPGRSYVVNLPDPGRLPELVRERVTSTIVVSQRVALVGRRGARIIGRRHPDQADLDWVIVYDAGLNRDAPGVQERIRSTVLDLRSNLGV